MRCYFCLSHGREVLPDYEGVECSSPDEAYAETLQAIYDVYEECDRAQFDWNGWTLTALNAAGEVLFSVSLANVEVNAIVAGSADSDLRPVSIGKANLHAGGNLPAHHGGWRYDIA